ncbi:MAG: SH3 domain-containing protein [Kouleothrix sp.]|jgi:uncharacterized protein YgiM (DUF1202 family)|nr:SH3 domain-containing protein [Kouleothrix sp.]
MGLFGKGDEMKKVGEDMAKLSEQIGELQKKLAAKTSEADGLRTQAAAAAGSSVALEDAQAEIEVLRNQLAEMKAQHDAPAATVLEGMSKLGAPAPVAEGLKSAAAAVGGLTAGAQAWVTRAGGLPLRLRSAPSLSGDILDRLEPGTQMTLLDGPQQADGHAWWHIRTSGGGEGWVAGEDLRTQAD